jgi:hypothetical protein
MHKRLIAGLLVGAGVLLTVVPAQAQEGGDPIPSGEPGFVDGLWVVNLVSTGPVDIGEAQASVTASGGGLLTVADEVVSGEYTVHGDDVVIAPDGGATGTLTSVGEWGGTATKPAMIDGDSIVEGTVTVEGHTQEVSFSFPSSGTMTVIPIISATCTIVEGDWPTVANAAFAAQGVSSGIDGVWIAIRLLDALPGEEPPDYLEEAFAVHTDGLLFYAETIESGEVNYYKLNQLLTRAEELYDRLQRAADCGIGNAEAWQGLLAGMTGMLLQYAIDNPDQFDNMELMRLTSAAFRMGLIGSGAATGDYGSELTSNLADSLGDRMDQADEENDCDGAIAIVLMGSLIDDVSFAGRVGGACGG